MTRRKKRMDAATMERLREIGQKKRGTLLKDVDAAQVLISADFVEERVETSDQLPGTDAKAWAYLKWATPEQIAALSGRLCHRRMWLPVRIGNKRRLKDSRLVSYRGQLHRRVTAFPVVALRTVLKFTGVTDPDRYISELWLPVDSYPVDDGTECPKAPPCESRDYNQGAVGGAPGDGEEQA